MTRWGVLLPVAAVLTLPAGLTAQRRATLPELEALARADSNDPVAHYNVAAVLVEGRRYAEAERSLRQAIDIDPEYAPALLLLARVRMSLVGAPLAVVVGNRRIVFLRRDASGGETARLQRRAFLIDPLLELGPPPRAFLPAAWRETLGRALRDYEHERWVDAIAGFTTVVDRTVRPTDSMDVPPVALWFRARSAMRLGDYDAAIRDVKWLLALRLGDTTSQALTWNPFVGDELRYILAYVHQLARRWDDAIRLYQELLERNLGLDLAHSHLAEIYEEQGRWADAIQERRRAIDANPEEPALLFDLGSTLAYGGEYAEAEETLLTYAGVHPREARTYYLLGFVRMRLGKGALAREALTQYLALAPRRYEDQIADAKRRLAMLQD
jgi:tetratricopeptide (TPR) repeat protein